MKKCPICDKTFEDSMKFCQTDGTVLVDDAPAFDPYATIIAPMNTAVPDEIPVEATPDPVVDEAAGSAAIAPPEEVLDLPDVDPLKTMHVSEDEMRTALGDLEAPAEPDIIDLPPIEEAPVEASETTEEAEAETVMAPELPNFSVPDPPAPSFGDLTPPPSPFSPPPSPFEEPMRAPAAFEEASPAPPDFAEPLPAPPVFEEPAAASFNELETMMEPARPSPFDTPSAPAADADWTPPPAPDAGWQNQQIGANTPFQPPPAGASGPSSILAFVSLGLGIVGVLGAILTLVISIFPFAIVICGIFPFLFGLGAAITGFLARSRAKSMPDKYAGGGIAMAGLVLGVLDIIAPFVIVGLWLLFFGGVALLS